MGKWIGYIVLAMVVGYLTLLIHPVVAILVGFGIVAGTLLFIVDILKREQPRVIEDRLRKHFLLVRKSVEGKEQENGKVV
ncbi:hypothetical protein [Brevibacillus brevis]|uniref:Uncharacterized protein n=1 Tax=Brevibacillus brevis TaxID=1393 RepID=A0ABY9T5L1_BREBE|nr:hypothetical protein [Brevibacillus brevis]WNC14774.1 hypothetical protein RGB73_29635 [Brevibacillus brevis]